MFLIAATTFAQSDVVTDSIPPISLDGYKNFNGFMLDMGSMIIAPPPLIAPQLYYQPYNNNAIANYNEIFRPNMNIIYDRGSYNHVSVSYTHLRNNNDAKIHRKSIIQSFCESFFHVNKKIYLPLLLQRVTVA